MRTLAVLVAVLVLAQCAIVKRQTYTYDEALRAYAHPNKDTKVIQGYLARYAPQDWPRWYARNMMKWDGESRMSPYDKNDVRYEAYQRSQH